MDYEKASSWTRNVKNEFKNKTEEEIREILSSTCYPAAVAMENWHGDFNLSTCLRNVNGFNLKEMFYIGGSKSFDRRGAVGVHHYTKLSFYKTIQEFIANVYSNYTLIGIDNIPETNPKELISFDWPDNSLMIFGEEGLGLSKEIIEVCDYIVSIPMYGSVRSFNCGTSSGIILYDYIRKFNEKHKTTI